MRQTMVQLNEIVSDKCIFVSTAKGIENKTNKRMSEVIKEETGRSAAVSYTHLVRGDVLNTVNITTSVDDARGNFTDNETVNIIAKTTLVVVKDAEIKELNLSLIHI